MQQLIYNSYMKKCSINIISSTLILISFSFILLSFSPYNEPSYDYNYFLIHLLKDARLYTIGKIIYIDGNEEELDFAKPINELFLNCIDKHIPNKETSSPPKNCPVRMMKKSDIEKKFGINRKGPTISVQYEKTDKNDISEKRLEDSLLTYFFRQTLFYELDNKIKVSDSIYISECFTSCITECIERVKGEVRKYFENDKVIRIIVEIEIYEGQDKFNNVREIRDIKVLPIEEIERYYQDYHKMIPVDIIKK